MTYFTTGAAPVRWNDGTKGQYRQAPARQRLAARVSTATSGLVPSIAWLRQYRSEWLRPDVTAGLTAAAVVIPKAMAYATIAGLPVQVGLYTAFVPMVVYALLGTSRAAQRQHDDDDRDPDGAADSAAHAPGGDPAALIAAGATLAVLVGPCCSSLRVLRLGFVANFISEPVLVGFKSGIGLVIVVDQIPKLLGIHIDKAGFFRDLVAIAQPDPAVSLATLVLAVALFVADLRRSSASRRARRRRWSRSPSAHRGIGAARAERRGVETVGNVPRGLPALVLAATWISPSRCGPPQPASR